ncbi:hypothetical protein CLIM01_07757 [Colletotrichum limetticola]|uniref:Uncharacterized protein n=1 Tax=Colletotrichum limetticola TaxID=1209924 RepID=A0ABQ9PTP0_9PEZI|nr:hypothetical protein CLIM01_07757 [Colletotrichum limetticola]
MIMWEAAKGSGSDVWVPCRDEADEISARRGVGNLVLVPVGGAVWRPLRCFTWGFRVVRTVLSSSAAGGRWAHFFKKSTHPRLVRVRDGLA